MHILPFPRKYVKIAGTFLLNGESRVYCDESLLTEVERFAKSVEESCGFSLKFVEDISEANVIFKYNENCSAEGYHIMISQGMINASFASGTGCYYAIETLMQLFNLCDENAALECENCYIEDEPKFAYRGLLLDVSRHFFPVSTVKRVIDLMSQVKLNKLHLHLTDDQGFRIQIDKYPLLNEIGSVRYGSEKLSNGKRFVDEVEHSGFYTKDDIRELVKYAEQRRVEIIPEIDIPGHCVAALAAYPQYSCSGAVGEVRKRWGISKDILCAGNEETYSFIKDILTEVCELFPSEYVHLGGDEVPKDRWCNCKLCREKLSELKLSGFEELQTYMIEQFRLFLEEKGKKVICWNDGVTKSASFEIISQSWKPLTHAKSVNEANSGRKTIMSPFFKLYFDYPYAMTPLRKTRNFNPLKGVKRNSQNNILGVEGAVWTEYIADEDKLFFNLLPRIDALAECAWGSKLNDFDKRIESKTAVYEKQGLRCNKTATQNKFRNPFAVKRFFSKDSDDELNRSK